MCTLGMPALQELECTIHDMFHFAFLLSLSPGLRPRPAMPPVDIDTAAQLYQEAAIREQVRASLGSMPAHIRQLFPGNTSTPLSDSQLARGECGREARRFASMSSRRPP